MKKKEIMMKKTLKQEKKSRTVSRQGFKRSPKLSSLLNSRTVDNNTLIFKNTGVKEGKPRKRGQGKKFRKNISEKSFFFEQAKAALKAHRLATRCFLLMVFFCVVNFISRIKLYTRVKRMPFLFFFFAFLESRFCSDVIIYKRGKGGEGERGCGILRLFENQRQGM